ncbi:MAG: enoyl-CoA hydratase/isomerase family protein [Gemmatimonadales bacterium]
MRISPSPGLRPCLFHSSGALHVALLSCPSCLSVALPSHSPHATQVLASLVKIRPLHALDIQLTQGLGNTIRELEADETVRALVITGTGSIFCAGVDLFRILEGGPDYTDEFFWSLVETLKALFGCPHPLVAAINGHAIAGGCVLAAASDYRIMARGPGKIGVPELRVGMPFPLVAIEILRFATSDAHLQELIYQGKTYAVGEAYERGLLDEVVEPDSLLQRAQEVAANLCSEPSARFRITKRQLRAPSLRQMEYGPDTDSEVLDAWKDPTTVAAIQEYVRLMRNRG